MTSAARSTPWMMLAALSGLVSAGVFLAVAELTALLVPGGSGPLEAVGAFVVDVVPRPLKEFAVSAFGAADKAVLLGGLLLAAAIAAALAGVLEFRRPPWGTVAVGAVAVATAAALVTRAAAGPSSAMTSASSVCAKSA